jgi:hypothetical protein
VRLRTLFAFVFWTAFLGFGAYCVATLGTSYLQTAGMVEQAVGDVRRRPRATGSTDSARAELVNEVRAAIIYAARREGLTLDPQQLIVSIDAEGLHVRLRWPQPLVSYAGQTLVFVNLWLDRSFELRGGPPVGG